MWINKHLDIIIFSIKIHKQLIISYQILDKRR